MTQIPAEVTGEEAQRSENSALGSLVRFYHGFNSGDLDALEAVWAAGELPSMDNPVGGILRGWPAIRDGYKKLFDGPANVKVTFHDFTSFGDDTHHLFVGREKGICETTTTRLDLRFRTTRWFNKIDGAWRLIHHHGSIDEPEMLFKYQTIIFGKPLSAPA